METVAGRIPVEPFNTYSNLIFLLIVLYWSRKVYGKARRHPFLAAAIPVIVISLIGGIMFHGTRSDPFWLYLDWVPIMLLSMAFVVYTIFKITPHYLHRALIFSAVLLFSFGLRFLPMPGGLRISLGYLITALTISIPLLVYLARTHWRFAGWVVAAFLTFGLAITFRSIDRTQTVLPMGTHWLWHILGGVAVHLMLIFVYKDREYPKDFKV